MKLHEQAQQPPKRVEKTKEELAEIRKQMMKSRPKAADATTTKTEPGKEELKQQANSELMQRLARGEKAEVNKKEMLKLTNKNYE